MATGRIGTTPVLTTRWSKAPSAGTTSLSGLDDNSVSLVYSVGYEAVYQNGVLLSRGNDYTATNGTTITLTTATVAGDIIEVFANQTIPLTDTYSQTVANSLFVNQATFDAKGDLIAGTADNTYSRLAVGANNTVLTADSSTGTGLKWAAVSSTPTYAGCLATSGSDQNISNNTITAITFSTEEFDTDGYHSTSTNTSRITIPTGKAGYYSVYGFAAFNTNSTAGRVLYIYKNGSAYRYTQQAGIGSGRTGVFIQATINLAVGDYVELFAFQDSGTTIDVGGGTQRLFFGADFLGA